MTLPATLVKAEIRLIEADALAYAQREIAKWRSMGNPYGTGDSVLTPEASRALLRQMYKNIALTHCDRMMDIIALARSGDPDADDALLELIREFLSRGEQLPTELAAYNMEVTRRGEGWHFRKRQGKKWYHHITRNICITLTVAAVCDHFPPLKPTGRSPHRRSASSIVAEALGEAEFVGQRGCKAVEAIWGKYKCVAPTEPPFGRYLRPS
jgi:hypothetical protein